MAAPERTVAMATWWNNKHRPLFAFRTARRWVISGQEHTHWKGTRVQGHTHTHVYKILTAQTHICKQETPPAINLSCSSSIGFLWNNWKKEITGSFFPLCLLHRCRQCFTFFIQRRPPALKRKKNPTTSPLLQTELNVTARKWVSATVGWWVHVRAIHNLTWIRLAPVWFLISTTWDDS